MTAVPRILYIHENCQYSNMAAAQTNMERGMLNDTCVGEKTKVTDMIEQVRRRKWTWAGHVSRIRDNRWTSHMTTWRPYEGRLSRPSKRWSDELEEYWKATMRQRIALIRQMWEQHVEAFVLPQDVHYRCTMMMMILEDETYITQAVSIELVQGRNKFSRDVCNPMGPMRNTIA